MATVVALSRPAPSLSAAGLYALFYLLGGAWAALITLVFWPLRVYRPARVAIANALRALAGVAQSLIDADTSAAAQVERRKRLGEARSAIEVARVQLGSLRRGRIGSTTRGERLVGLVESGRFGDGALVAIEDGLAFEPPEHLPELQTLDRTSGGFVESQLTEIAQALEDEKPLPPSMLAKVVAREGSARCRRVTQRVTSRGSSCAQSSASIACVSLASGIDDPNAPALVDRSELSALRPKLPTSRS